MVELTSRARELTLAQTRAEARVWNTLRDRRLGGWKWKRQVPRGRYIVDFLCTEARLVVELDGGQHANAAKYDATRTAYLEGLGYRVLRFWNAALEDDAEGVFRSILEACGGEKPQRVADAPPPHLTSPEGEG
jgi:very-short-patch-repair endonuclease